MPDDNEEETLSGDKPLSDNDPADAVNDSQVLHILNRLRQFEGRPLLFTLPPHMLKLSSKEKYEWIKRMTSECDVHDQLKLAADKQNHPYPNQVILNKTETAVFRHFRTHGLEEKTPIFLKSHDINEDDLDFYYPKGIKGHAVFVTDSPAKCIGTPTYSFATGHTMATHCLNSGRQDCTMTWSETPKIPEFKQRFIFPPIKEHPPSESIEDFENLKIQIDTLQKEVKTYKDKEKSLNLKPKSSKDIGRIMSTLVKEIEHIKKQEPTVDPIENPEWEEIKEAVIPEQNLDLLYTLERPSNIIAKTVVRYPENLPILKPSMIQLTIGTFNPEVEELNDFKGIWDSIIDHTKDYEVYEHEYICILKMVMKGQAAQILRLIIREFKGNLESILTAIQDMYVPEHTFFDDYIDINGFQRQPKEPIRATIRRATFAINPLKKTVPAVAWENKKETMLITVLKQVIDNRTLKHLKREEYKCRQNNTILDIESMINIVSLYEVAHDLIPKSALRLQFNVNTMSLIQPVNVNKSEIDILREQVEALAAKSLVPKRPRLDNPMERRLNSAASTPNRGIKRSQSEGNGRPSQQISSQSSSSTRNFPSSGNSTPQHRKILIPSTPSSQPSRPSSASSYIRPYQTPPKPNAMHNSAPPSTPDRRSLLSRPRTPNSSVSSYAGIGKSPYRPNRYQSQQRYKPYSQNRSNYRNNRGYDRNRNSYRGRSKTYRFTRGRNDVTLHFYKCTTCPNMHPNGGKCDEDPHKSITFHPNS